MAIDMIVKYISCGKNRVNLIMDSSLRLNKMLGYVLEILLKHTKIELIEKMERERIGWVIRREFVVNGDDSVEEGMYSTIE